MDELKFSTKPTKSRSPQDFESTPGDESPSVTVEAITFSDGTQIRLDLSDVVVLVGPNNAGKSLGLRELEEYFDDDPIGMKVVSSVQWRKNGTQEGFAIFVEKHTQIKARGSSLNYTGRDGLFQNTSDPPEKYWPNRVKPFRALFCKRISSATRISDSDPVNAIDIVEEPLDHPIHMLFSDDKLERDIGGYFRRAFGQDLILDRGAGKTWPLLVGHSLKPCLGESLHSTAYLQRLRRSTVPLNQQGDGMRSFASVVLHLLAPVSPSILLLDEPEAFLHPPQARLLGEIIGTEKSTRAQLFLATHSSDVLQGLINVAPEHLRILRMQRDGNVNRIKELDKEIVKKISLDPIMRYSSVLSGLFHERVIICEADADCMFYSSILDLSEVHGETHLDVLFVHANGKHRMATLAETLVALDVPVDIVADIDVLNDLTVLEKIVKALKGDWLAVEPIARAIKTAVEERRLGLHAIEVRDEIMRILEGTPSEGDFPKRMRSEIQKIFRKASSWDVVKEGGESALPSGEGTKKFQKLRKLCGRMGLWIVPVGEMERFCKSVGGHGARWVQQVVEERDLATDPELDPARQFVKQLWESKSSDAAAGTARGI